MEDRVESLFQEWHRLGGAVLLSQAGTVEPVRPPEAVIAESTAHCRASGRLTWVVLDWLIRHVEQLDEQALLGETIRCGDLAVLGVLCDAAQQRRPNPRLERLMRACHPNRELELFFHRVARSPLAARLAREHALDVFRRWNFLCGELRYLEDEVGGDRPAAVIGAAVRA